MRRLKRWVGRALLVVLVLAAVWLVPTLWFKPWSIDVFYGRVFAGFMLRHPILLTSLGMIDGTPLDFHSGKLDDLSPAAERREAGQIANDLATLRSYDVSHMTPPQKLSRDVLDWFLADIDAGDRRFKDHDYPVNQLQGFQTSLPDFMISIHPIHSGKDVRHYVERISRFGVATDQIIAQLEERAAIGVIPPRWVLDKSLAQMRSFRAHEPKDNPLYTTLLPKLDKLKDLSAKERQRMLGDLEQQVSNTVYPAWDRLIAESERLASRATDQDGVWKLPDGDAYYAWCLRHNTTTDLPADTIHALGLREVARIQAQMRSILAREHYPTTQLAATVQAIQKEPRFMYPANDSGRAMILADYRSILDDSDRRVAALFDVRPKAALSVERVPPFKEGGSAGAYYNGGSLDGKRPGTFYANLRLPGETSRPSMRTLAYHEGIPGHHFQVSIAQELTGVPFFRKVIPFTAYAEGWALYAERLALENGFHPTAFDSLGALQAEIFRAVRLVVDTGIHRDRWTRQQAIDYMVANTGMDSSEVASEIERYIVNPGQACAYKVGQLKILELRRHAQQELGDRFDLKKFHSVVITNGALPLDLLERVVNDWIASEQSAAGVKRSG